MTPTSRRALLSSAVTALICASLPSFAYSVEPILRSPGGLLADLGVGSSDPDAKALRSLLSDVLSPKVFAILREEAQKAQLAVPVVKESRELAEAPNHSILYVRMRLDIKTTVVADERQVIGAAGMKFQRKGYEALQAALPLSLFLAPEEELATKAEAAIREQFAGLVNGMQKTRL